MSEGINWSVKDGRLTLRIPEDMTSENAERFHEEICGILAGTAHETVAIDLSAVTYVSSAGLRVFLSLNKTEKSLTLTGASPYVYEILEITGLDKVMTVSRAMREVSLAQAELIGDGFFSRVYRLDAENIIKVFIRDSSEENIRRELELDKYALISGIPTAISYDVVKTDDGKMGVIYEMMNCGSFRDAIRDKPDETEQLLDQYAAMMKELHAAVDKERRLPDARKQILGYLDRISRILTPDETEMIRRLLETIPESDGIIHGDCHFKNIMMHNGEPLLIDLDTLSRGDPVIELGYLFYTYMTFEELWPGNSSEFLGLDADKVKAVFTGLLRRYFGSCGPAAYEENMIRIRTVGYLKMLVYLEEFESENHEAIRLTKERLVLSASGCRNLCLSYS